MGRNRSPAPGNLGFLQEFACIDGCQPPENGERPSPTRPIFGRHVGGALEFTAKIGKTPAESNNSTMQLERSLLRGNLLVFGTFCIAGDRLRPIECPTNGNQSRSASE